jgi:hypothetical protein
MRCNLQPCDHPVRWSGDGIIYYNDQTGLQSLVPKEGCRWAPEMSIFVCDYHKFLIGMNGDVDRMARLHPWKEK